METMKKAIGYFCFAIIFAGVAVLMIGCGAKQEQALAYYNPTWSAEGKIYAIKETIVTATQGGFGGSVAQERNSYLVLMNKDGSNEQTIKHVGRERYPKMNASPSGNYLAMTGGAGWEILDIHNGYNVSSEIDTTTQTLEFDWSPNEAKIFLQESGRAVALYNRNGTKIRDLSNLDYAFAWRYAAAIGGAGNNKIRLVDENDNIIAEQSAGNGLYGIHQYFPGGQYILGGGGRTFQKVRVSDFAVLETYTALKTELDKETSVYGLQLNPVNGTELLYSDNLESFNIHANKNILLINLDGTQRRRLK